MFPTRFSDADLQRMVARCSRLPLPPDGDFLVDDYVENMLLTVLDIQLHGTAIRRAMAHFQQHAQADVRDFEALKKLLDAEPDTQMGNLQVALYLWGYKYWTRVALLRRLLAFFEDCGVTTQEALRAWAAKADFERDFKGRVKGAGRATFQWLVMRQGVETIQPDTWVHRFIKDTLGYAVSDETAIELLETVALEMGVKAYELDWRIWDYQRNFKAF